MAKNFTPLTRQEKVRFGRLGMGHKKLKKEGALMNDVFYQAFTAEIEKIAGPFDIGRTSQILGGSLGRMAGTVSRHGANIVKQVKSMPQVGREVVQGGKALAKRIAGPHVDSFKKGFDRGKSPNQASLFGKK